LPLTHSAASEAKKQTTRPTSVGIPTRSNGDNQAAHCGRSQHVSYGLDESKVTYLIDLLVREILSTWNVLSSHSLKHICLDSPWCNSIDCDLLVTAVDCLDNG
jgi:hypothetical protein